MLPALFTDHPESVGETYGEHMVMASFFARRMFLASIACFIHAFLPFLFVKTGSETITDLHERMVTNRHNQTPDRMAAKAAVASR